MGQHRRLADRERDPGRRALAIRTPVYLETGLGSGRRRRAMGYVFRFPGLFVEADSPDRVLELLPAAIAAEHQWLRGHGVSLAHAAEPIEPVEIEEIERIDLATDVSRGIWRGLFQYELRPTTEVDVERALERARFAREDLLALLPSERAAALAPRLIAHADAEWELLSRLGSRLAGELPAEPLPRLAEVRARAEDRLRNLLPGDRERLAVFEGEKWTTRKVLRCLAVGERRLLWAIITGRVQRSLPRLRGRA